jgi:hypothetical protein
VTKFTSLCAVAHKKALTGEFRVYRKRGGYAETRRVREAAIIEHAGSLEPLGPGLFPPQRLCPNNSATNKAFQR